jgi:hypothetical protein
MTRQRRERCPGAGEMSPSPQWPAGRRERLEVLWRVQTTSGVVWECVWYGTTEGFELRIEREDDQGDVIAVRCFATLGEVIAVYAAEWKRTAVLQGCTPV